jgi:uncharacterized membrane protein YgdD (TMEM256/DUF423 family)
VTKLGPWAFVAAIAGFLGVAFGAFAAHAISDPQAKGWIDTGSRYQLAHTMTIFVSISLVNWGARAARFAPAFFTLGIVLFCGSLYAMAFGAPRWFGAITPLGGVSFLAGWGILAFAGLQLMGKNKG